MELITVQLREVVIQPTSQGGKVREITVTENGSDDYRLNVHPCATLPYYTRGEIKDLAVEEGVVFAATTTSGFSDGTLYFDSELAPPDLADKLRGLGAKLA